VVSFWFTKKYEKAIESCERVIELDSEQPEAYYYLGLVNYELNKIEESITYYKKAIKLDKTLKKAWYHLGISYFNLKNNFLAINAFKHALNSKSKEIKDEYIWIYLAEIYSRKKLDKEALRTGFKAIEINPQYWNAYTHTGYYYFKLEKYKEAIKIFNKAIKLNPNDFFSRNYIGLSLKKLEKFEESRIVFEKILKMNPKNSTARISLGLLCMRFNQPLEAIKHFKKGANNKNLDDIDCYLLAYNLYQLKEHNLAFNLINRGLNRNPNNISLYDLKEELVKKKINKRKKTQFIS
jgi:superkiller protein 3